MNRPERYLRKMKYAQQFGSKYFEKKFGKISKINWCVGKFNTRDNKRCASGHCGVTNDKNSMEGSALSSLFKNYGFLINEVSDNTKKKYSYLGLTPQQRVLRALKLIKIRESKKKVLDAN